MPNPDPLRMEISATLQSWQVYLPQKDFEILIAYSQPLRQMLYALFVKFNILKTETFQLLVNHDWKYHAENEYIDILMALEVLINAKVLNGEPSSLTEFLDFLGDSKNVKFLADLGRIEEEQEYNRRVRACMKELNKHAIVSLKNFLLIAELSVYEMFDVLFSYITSFLKNIECLDETCLQVLSQAVMKLPNIEKDYPYLLKAIFEPIVKFRKEKLLTRERALNFFSLVPNNQERLSLIADLMIFMIHEDVNLTIEDLRKYSQYPLVVMLIAMNLKQVGLLSEFSKVGSKIDSVSVQPMHAVLAKLNSQDPSLLTPDNFVLLFLQEDRKYNFKLMWDSLKQLKKLDQRAFLTAVRYSRPLQGVSSLYKAESFFKKYSAKLTPQKTNAPVGSSNKFTG